MAKLTRTDAVWHTVDTDTLPGEIGERYRDYKDAYKAMKADREAFEQLMSKAIDPAKGKRVIFGYNFGKLSVAVVDDDKPSAKRPSGSIDLAALVRRT